MTACSPGALKAVGLAVLVALALEPRLAAAQLDMVLVARYETAVTALQQQRDLDPALLLARDWTREQFTRALALSRQDSPWFWRAAALLHLEIAAQVADTSADDGLFHVHLGERALSPVVRDVPAAPRDFVARWSVVASSVFLARTDAPHARAALKFGLDRRPRDAGVRLAAGAIEDLASFELDVEGPGPPMLNRSVSAARSRRAVRLARAEQEYRRAVELAPDHGPARIRLGRILFRRGQLDEARSMFEPVNHAALATGDRYLWLLFSSAVFESLGDVNLARAGLQEAVRIVGDRQGSWMALAQLEERQGRPDRARAIVAQGLTRRRAELTDEWWEYRNGRFDQEGMKWLRAAVWQ